jgi:hypothetical protein
VFGFVQAELPGVAGDGFVEESGFKEEEGHEEVGPVHNGLPPFFLVSSYILNGVECYHAEYAYAAQQIKRMISCLRHLWFLSIP